MKVRAYPGDPPVRKDGKCARRGCSKQRHPERSLRYGGAAAQLDPFCSTDCCRAHYNIELRRFTEMFTTEAPAVA